MAGKIKAITIGDNRIDLVDKAVVGELTNLNTTVKDSIVNAVNEVNNKGGGTSYTAGNGIDITGDSISINQETLDKIAAVDNKVDKTVLNSYYSKTEANNLLNAKATTQALTNETNARANADTTITNKLNQEITNRENGDNSLNTSKRDKWNINDSTPYETGDKLNGRNICKIVWQDIQKFGVRIESDQIFEYYRFINEFIEECYNVGNLLDTKVYGWNHVEDDGTIVYVQPKLIYKGGTSEGGIGLIKIRTNNTMTMETIPFSQFASTNLDYIKAIEITFLGD